jgi:hypothetical protein
MTFLLKVMADGINLYLFHVYLDEFVNYRLQGVVFGGAIARQQNVYPIRHIQFSCGSIS